MNYVDVVNDDDVGVVVAVAVVEMKGCVQEEERELLNKPDLSKDVRVSSTFFQTYLQHSMREHGCLQRCSVLQHSCWGEIFFYVIGEPL